MSTILFVTWDGGGNVPPAIAIAVRLAQRGHDVSFVGHRANRGPVEAAGLAFREYARAAHFDGSAGNSMLHLVGMFGDPTIGDDAVAVARETGADLVVVDCLLPGALQRLGAAGIPYVLLEHFFDAYLREKVLRGPCGLLWRARGLHYRALSDAAHACVVTTLAELDPGYRKRRANVLYAGAAVDGTATARKPAGEPRILVSLSTFAYPGMVAVYRRIFDAVANLPIRAVVTIGPAVDPAGLPAPGNVEVQRFVPHADLLPSVSLVVGHGGHATTMAALAHDVPVLVLPMSRVLDQPMVGDALERAGAGKRLKRTARPEQIAAVISDLLTDDSTHAAAARLGAQIRESDGAGVACTQLERIIGRVAA